MKLNATITIDTDRLHALHGQPDTPLTEEDIVNAFLLVTEPLAHEGMSIDELYVKPQNVTTPWR